ncbi:hypothetical protein ZIOFF_053934 [Zingiber officinale]|uniref:Membrane lipoprotein n=2 Tax=Zingiber officinale TaxID=94328 RepID=A0A8J5FDT8_ZINOF|nr:hypothetical protein ZIOFF_053934 [Zingiber officinale]
MRSLSSLITGLSLVSILLVFALLAKVYMFLRKKRNNRAIEDNSNIPIKQLHYPFCWTWKRPSPMVIHQQESSTSVDLAAQSDQLHLNPSKDTVEAELMRLYNLGGPPRLLFTIKEETKEDMESEDGRSTGRRSIKCYGGKSLSDLFNSSDHTPLTTSPPMSPLDCRTGSGFNFNPLFESSKEEDFTRMWSSPSPKFKFLKDAELKFYRKIQMEEAKKADASGEMVDNSEKQSIGYDEEEGDETNFISIVIGKTRDGEKQQHSSSSQVMPLSSPILFK